MAFYQCVFGLVVQHGRSTGRRRINTTSYLDWRRRRSNGEVPLDEGTISATLADESNPADRVVERDELRRALRILSPHQRAVLVLRYYEGLTTTPSPRTWAAGWEPCGPMRAGVWRDCPAPCTLLTNRLTGRPTGWWTAGGRLEES